MYHPIEWPLEEVRFLLSADEASVAPNTPPPSAPLAAALGDRLTVAVGGSVLVYAISGCYPKLARELVLARAGEDADGEKNLARATALALAPGSGGGSSSSTAPTAASSPSPCVAVGTACGAFVLSFTLFFSTIKVKYRQTFFSVMTGKEHSRRIFLDNSDDAEKAKLLLARISEEGHVNPPKLRHLLEMAVPQRAADSVLQRTSA